MIDLSKYQVDQNIFIITPVNNDFEDLYKKVRKKEKRIYSDEEVVKLPFASGSNPHMNEWVLRAKTFLRFEEYLKTKNANLDILDLGCGNGWFSGNLAKHCHQKFFCVDINLTELKQGVRIFSSKRVNFLCNLPA